MSKILIGEYETSNFSFITIGSSIREIKKNMTEAWRNHCKQYPTADRKLFNRDDVTTYPIRMNEVLRDRTPIRFFNK
jgi:hypothetical protein